MDKRYNIRYKGEIYHPNVSIEECSNLLSSIAERFYSGEDDEINPSFLEMEELINGRME
tara:strand:+ start:478 stop:654 length:177 start_codon:yes stop_codon:yes gene_type:complete